MTKRYIKGRTVYGIRFIIRINSSIQQTHKLFIGENTVIEDFEIIKLKCVEEHIVKQQWTEKEQRGYIFKMVNGVDLVYNQYPEATFGLKKDHNYNFKRVTFDEYKNMVILEYTDMIKFIRTLKQSIHYLESISKTKQDSKKMRKIYKIRVDLMNRILEYCEDNFNERFEFELRQNRKGYKMRNYWNIRIIRNVKKTVIA